jgi:dolichol-phosphate mannosyltransferase
MEKLNLQNHIIGVVIPSYKVKKNILDVIKNMPEIVSFIYLIDDLCPENSGEFVKANISDESRLKYIFHKVNKGVGGAVKSGYISAISDNCTIIIKIDGDGQMDPKMIPYLIHPIVNGEADYAKGNRFFDLESINKMPTLRIIGNSALSFITKFSSGYWNIFDPTNGYTAIHIKALKRLNLNKISNRYFFESDMLFRLNIIRAVVVDVYIAARYGLEKSNLSEGAALVEFSYKNVKNFIKRIFYSYYLRDMNIGSFVLPIGVIMIIFGTTYGGYHWYISTITGINTSVGTAILSALSILTGVQFLLAFLNVDLSSIPNKPIQKN